MLYSPPRYSVDRPPDSQTPSDETLTEKNMEEKLPRNTLQTLCLRVKKVSPEPVKSPCSRAAAAPPSRVHPQK